MKTSSWPIAIGELSDGQIDTTIVWVRTFFRSTSFKVPAIGMEIARLRAPPAKSSLLIEPQKAKRC